MPVFDQMEALVSWLHQQQVQALVCDSRRLRPGSGFVAWPGAAQDGRRYVAAALAQGAPVCVVEAQGCADFPWAHDPRVAVVPQLKKRLGTLAALFHGQPSRHLPVLALTGTNGKTSTAWWTAQWLSALGQPTALAGTLGLGQPGQALQVTGLTTPDPVWWQSQLATWVAEGLQAVAVEASSIGLQEARLDGTAIHSAVFLNLSQDHLDYHGSMEAYWQAKKALFDWPGLAVAVVNIDDPRGMALAAELRSRVDAGTLSLWTVSLHHPQARLRACDWRLTDTGAVFAVQERADRGESLSAATLSVPVVGAYNQYNLLAALALVRAQGHALAAAVAAAAALSAVPGRMQAVALATDVAKPWVLVDYCHTPDAVAQAVAALRPLAQRRGGKLWVLVGCGGDRDATKRPLMAAAAQNGADGLCLTSDNPRSEDPLQILAQMQAGLLPGTPVHIEPDRARAIARVVAQAQAQDVVLLAGKGHEATQEVAGVQYPFSDLEHGRMAWQRWQAPQENP